MWAHVVVCILRRWQICEGEAELTDSTGKKPSNSPRRSQFARYAIPLGTMGGTLALVAVIYLGYDLAKGELAPCESIFQQTSVGLTTSIKFLKTEGELQIGREQLTDLDERAQMAALNLKTCCTVLDAGRLDPEQFLQCKGKVRAYESRIGDIVDIVRSAVREEFTTGSIAANAAPASPAPPASSKPQINKSLKAEITKEVEAARTISREFNKQVVQVAKERALQTLKATPPRNIAIEAKESEPNNDILTTNELTLGKWVTGSVGGPKDTDFYTFTTPEKYRDWIRIELQNRSTTLEPHLMLYSAQKAHLGTHLNKTRGADLTYSFVGAPNTKYIVRASNYYGENVGVYLIRVVPAEAYDAHEPNGDILKAKTINVGATVEASVMDKNDMDYYVLKTGDDEVNVRIDIENRSTTLRPEIGLYDANKTWVGHQINKTGGGDASYTFKAQPNTKYYIRVRDYYADAAGDYTMTLSAEPPKNG
jgi:hypothetical protein